MLAEIKLLNQLNGNYHNYSLLYTKMIPSFSLSFDICLFLVEDSLDLSEFILLLEKCQRLIKSSIIHIFFRFVLLVTL